MKISAALIGAVAAAGFSFYVGTIHQKRIDSEACDKKIQEVRAAAAKAIDDQLAINLVTTAERDQARSEVFKVNESTVAQYTALQTMLADDRIKRDEASTRVEAAAKEAAKNARTAGDRAAAARDLITKINDRCASSDIPSDVLRMLDGIASASEGSGMVASALPTAASHNRP